MYIAKSKIDLVPTLCVGMRTWLTVNLGMRYHAERGNEIIIGKLFVSSSVVLFKFY